MITVCARVDQTRPSRHPPQNRAHDDLRLLGNHHHVLAIFQRGEGAGRGIAGRFSNDIQREIHHQIGIFQHHLLPSFDAVQCLRSVMGDNDLALVESRQLVGAYCGLDP